MGCLLKVEARVGRLVRICVPRPIWRELTLCRATRREREREKMKLFGVGSHLGRRGRPATSFASILAILPVSVRQTDSQTNTHIYIYYIFIEYIYTSCVASRREGAGPKK